MVNGLEAKEMVLSRKLADGQCYGSKRDGSIPGIIIWSMVWKQRDGLPWNQQRVLVRSKAEVPHRELADGSGVESKRWFYPGNLQIVLTWKQRHGHPRNSRWFCYETKRWSSLE
jgi:hypothetical protein